MTEKESKPRTLAEGLGWASLGLGLLRLVAAPKRRSGLARTLVLREVASGLGLISRRNPRFWTLARVAGDGVDLALLASDLLRGNRKGGRGWRSTVTTTAAIGVAALDLYTALKGRRQPWEKNWSVEVDEVTAPGLGNGHGGSLTADPVVTQRPAFSTLRS